MTSVSAAGSGGVYPSFSYSTTRTPGTGEGSSGPQILKSNFGPSSGAAVSDGGFSGGSSSPQALSTPSSASLGLGYSPSTISTGGGYSSSGSATGAGAGMTSSSTFSITV